MLFEVLLQLANMPFGCEQRKVTNDSCVHQESSSESVSDEIPVSSKTDLTNQETCKQPFYAAIDCLLLLKKSVENLHQKNLFPYNPEVLLRRNFAKACTVSQQTFNDELSENR
ncbi:hypothetical protein Ccrd_019051 [Cynara cardunculus var. scolymus]|uniref:Protein Lines C-terminal domain-containing protein n=1 Tax=Cynara cardunculus var. scolymus TaxID=59895 RepID=A0A118K1C7_CYNCS|nr:hypothetical protein Ccrd_019051 [Cynara cardunculus var. scolymus]